MPRWRSTVATIGAVVATLGCAGSPPAFPAADTGATDSSATSASSSDVSATTAPATAGDTSSGGSAPTGDEMPGSSSGSPEDSSTGEPAAGTSTGSEGGTGEECGRGIPTIEMTAEDAVLAGEWALMMSMLGEGTVIATTGAGSATFSTDLPCPATWHVWVRMLDAGQDDSLFVQVDGMPPGAEEAIFEVGCDAQPGTPQYVWRELNYREPSAGPCEYVYDPWTFDTGPGPIELVFWPRENGALSRVIFTTDPMFVPPPP